MRDGARVLVVPGWLGSGPTPGQSRGPHMPPRLASWRRIGRSRVPSAATVIYSDDDPLCSVELGRGMAADCSATAHGLGGAGHNNGSSGLGDWPAGLAYLQALRARST